MGIVAMKVLGAGMLGGCGKKELQGLPGAAIRYVLQDNRVHTLTVGMRYPAEIDRNIKTLAGDTTYTNKIGIRGFSAGGHLAINCAVNTEPKPADGRPRGMPNFAGLFHPGLPDDADQLLARRRAPHASAAPIGPMFIINGRTDKLTPGYEAHFESPRCRDRPRPAS